MYARGGHKMAAQRIDISYIFISCFLCVCVWMNAFCIISIQMEIYLQLCVAFWFVSCTCFFFTSPRNVFTIKNKTKKAFERKKSNSKQIHNLKKEFEFLAFYFVFSWKKKKQNSTLVFFWCCCWCLNRI